MQNIKVHGNRPCNVEFLLHRYILKLALLLQFGKKLCTIFYEEMDQCCDFYNETGNFLISPIRFVWLFRKKTFAKYPSKEWINVVFLDNLLIFLSFPFIFENKHCNGEYVGILVINLKFSCTFYDTCLMHFPKLYSVNYYCRQFHSACIN